MISLALVLKEFIGKNKATTLLQMAEEQPRILRKTAHLLLRLLDENFSYMTDKEEYLLQNNKSKIIFASSFRLVNGMDFDRVLIVLSHSEYYLKYYLPQAISWCAFDLTLIMLPKDKINFEGGVVQKFFIFFFFIFILKEKIDKVFSFKIAYFHNLKQVPPSNKCGTSYPQNLIKSNIFLLLIKFSKIKLSL